MMERCRAECFGGAWGMGAKEFRRVFAPKFLWEENFALAKGTPPDCLYRGRGAPDCLCTGNGSFSARAEMVERLRKT